MDAIRNGMEFNGRVWKEPRGFIKILELIFGICAFATTSSYSSQGSVNYACNDTKDITEHTQTYNFSYPFDLEDYDVRVHPCSLTNNELEPLGGSHRSSAQFFVAVGVLTFLYCLGALLLYIFLDKLYRTRENIPLADFILTIMFAFFWLVASSAWAHGVTGVKAATDPNYVVSRLADRGSDKVGCTSCQPGSYPNYANLNISVIFGFLNFFIWAGNVWFLYKETPWYKASHPTETVASSSLGAGTSGFASGLIPDSAIKDDCDAFASVRLCNDKVLRPCLAAELITLDPFIRQANEFVTLFCENEQFRRDYAHHGQCLAVTSADINQCITNYGSTVSDLAAISDNLTPQEVLHRSCCDGLHRLTQCSFDAAVRKCHPSSADFVKKFLYKMMKSTLQDWIARQCFEYQNQCVKDPVIMDQSSGLPDANFTSSLPNIPDGLQPTVEVTQQDPNFDTTTSWPFQHVTDSLPRITPGQPVAEGTTNILSHVRPVGSVGAPSISRGNESRTADDGVVLAAAVSPPVINPAVNVPVRDGPPSSDHSTGFFGSLHKPISIKTLPEKSKHRVKNYAGDTHPLARKFLLLIGTIAFLAGIN